MDVCSGDVERILWFGDNPMKGNALVQVYCVSKERGRGMKGGKERGERPLRE
jgi:hypothetical protein